MITRTIMPVVAQPYTSAHPDGVVLSNASVQAVDWQLRFQIGFLSPK